MNIALRPISTNYDFNFYILRILKIIVFSIVLTLFFFSIQFYDHGQKIMEYTEEKKERERVCALQEHLNNMATRIQVIVILH